MNELLETIKAYASESASLRTWSLSIMGASILAIVSTSYIQPAGLGWRLTYLIFIPAWIALAMSIYSGTVISRRLVAAFRAVYKQEMDTLRTIAIKTDTSYDSQLTTFTWAVYLFTLWLMIYVVWWIFIKPSDAENSPKK